MGGSQGRGRMGDRCRTGLREMEWAGAITSVRSLNRVLRALASHLALAEFTGWAAVLGESVCLSAATGGRAARSGPRGFRTAQKPSTASVTAVAMSDWRSGELITNSSFRLMMQPPSTRTAGIWVDFSTINCSYRYTPT